jgi:catechol 2,3-dioxygenase-like lactoylglutathione lyase family enzyme
MKIFAIDHVQVAMPAGQEETARAFYCDLLGFSEIVKPPALAARGGAWFSSGSVLLHLGVDVDFQPARKAHPAFLVETLEPLLARLGEACVEMKMDVPLDGYIRCHVFDPFGNRIELMQKI